MKPATKIINCLLTSSLTNRVMHEFIRAVDSYSGEQATITKPYDLSSPQEVSLHECSLEKLQPAYWKYRRIMVFLDTDISIKYICNIFYSCHRTL